MKIYCIIPAYDETGNLVELNQRLTAVFRRNKIIYKIFYVLQGNKKSCDIVKKIRASNKRIDYIYFQEPLGIGRAYKIGFNKVNSNWTHVLTLDADLNHQPEELPKFIQAYKMSHADFIIGSRFIPGGKSHDRRLWKIFISQLINLTISKIIQVNIHDKSSGYRLIRSSVILRIKDLLVEKDYPSYMELLLLALKSGCKIQEIPITYIPRNWGKSKMGKLKTGYDYFLFLVKLIFNSGIPKLKEHRQ